MHEDDITRISDREFYVLGSANLNVVSEALSLHFTSDDYDTIGGYCLGLLDHLPEKNEIILTDNNIPVSYTHLGKDLIWLFWLVFTLKEENVKVILMEN